MKDFLTSSIGRKYIVAITGIGLVLFVVFHLLGNLSLLLNDLTNFNLYADFLTSLGGLLILAEVGLIGIFLLHLVFAIVVTNQNKTARSQPYAQIKSKNGAHKSNTANKSMIITGLLLFAFIIMHIWQFKFGPGVEEGYTVVNQDGKEMRDLARLVLETFQNPWFVGIYVVSMIFLGFHLRHGIFSLFQSLGLANNKSYPLLKTAGTLVAIIIAFGFLIIPLSLYFCPEREGVGSEKNQSQTQSVLIDKNHSINRGKL